MRFVVIIVLIAVCYYIALHLIHNFRKWYHEAGREGPASGQSQEPPRSRTEYRNLEDEYRQILGITGQDSPGDIKRKYRDLLAKYHPDKVQHLGREFQEMAENKTRKILEAYQYFRKKHNL